jgi:AcrR family transcriptional regulator
MPRTEEANQKIREDRRKSILDASTIVFARKGLAAAKVEDITEVAGISQGLLYRYFDSLEDVFAALIERAVQHMVGRAQAVMGTPQSPWDKLLDLTTQFLNGISKEPGYYLLFSQAFALPGRVHEIIHGMVDLQRAIRDVVVEGQTAGQMCSGDPDRLAILYLACLYGLAGGVAIANRSVLAHYPEADDLLRFLKP